MPRKVVVFVLLGILGSGCSASKPWGQGSVVGALAGAAALGTAGGIVANNVTPPFENKDADRGAGVAIGLFTGAVVGAVVGHVFFDPEVVVEAPAAVPVEQKKIVLHGVEFDFASATLRAGAKPILEQAAQLLAESPDERVEVRGYTDSVGSEGFNLTLSRRRARAVATYLESAGVGAQRLSVEGFGMADPVADNATAEGREQNRRVELVPLD